MKLREIFWTFALGLGLAGGASASTLYFYDSVSPETGLRFKLECTLGCEAALFDGMPSSFSSTIGALGPFPGGSGTLDAVNDYTGEEFLSETEVDRGGVDTATFSSSAEYIAIKIGGGTDDSWGIVKNLASDNVFTFTKLATRSGLSHTREYGEIETSPIPLPAAGWMLIAGLGGLAALRRRNRTA